MDCLQKQLSSLHEVSCNQVLQTIANMELCHPLKKAEGEKIINLVKCFKWGFKGSELVPISYLMENFSVCEHLVFKKGGNPFDYFFQEILKIDVTLLGGLLKYRPSSAVKYRFSAKFLLCTSYFPKNVQFFSKMEHCWWKKPRCFTLGGGGLHIWA